MLFQPSANNFSYVPTILLYILWKYKYWFIQKRLCDIMQPLDITRNLAFSRSYYL